MNFEKPPKKSEFCKNKKKIKKKNTGDIIILHMCTKNHNQVQSMRYGVTQFFCHLGPICGPPLSLTPQKTKILKKKQKSIWRSGDIIIFNLCNKKHYQMMYAYSDMECDRQFFVILGHFLLFYPTIDLEN